MRVMGGVENMYVATHYDLDQFLKKAGVRINVFAPTCHTSRRDVVLEYRVENGRVVEVCYVCGRYYSNKHSVRVEWSVEDRGDDWVLVNGESSDNGYFRRRSAYFLSLEGGSLSIHRLPPRISSYKEFYQWAFGIDPSGEGRTHFRQGEVIVIPIKKMTKGDEIDSYGFGRHKLTGKKLIKRERVIYALDPKLEHPEHGTLEVEGKYKIYEGKRYVGGAVRRSCALR